MDIPFDPLKLDWLGKEEKMTYNSEFSITSAPIFLLGDEGHKEEGDEEQRNSDKDKGPDGLSKLALISIIIGSIIGVLKLVYIVLVGYKMFIRKKGSLDGGEIDHALMRE